jgi:hypothetical protein
LKFKAIRGGNQRGISFTLSDNAISETASITCKTQRVYSDLRGSDKVDAESIVIDARIFDTLGCIEGDEVILSAVSEKVPHVQELLMEVTSLNDDSHATVTDSLSNEIGDIKEDLDGLIIHIGSKIQILSRNIGLQVIEASPLSSKTRIARLSWKELGKIRLRALEEGVHPSEPEEHLTSSELEEILDRLIVLEDRCDSMLEKRRSQSSEGQTDVVSFEQVEKRIDESLFRLESMFTRISEIEKRLDRLVEGL